MPLANVAHKDNEFNLKSSFMSTQWASYYYGRISKEEASEILKNYNISSKEGLFLLRQSINVIGLYELLLYFNEAIYYYDIMRDPIDGMVSVNNGKRYTGPIELIKENQKELNDFITKPLLPCHRPVGVKPRFFSIIDDSFLNSLIQCEIEEHLQMRKEKEMLTDKEYDWELNQIRNKDSFKYEKIILENFHLRYALPWYKENLDRNSTDKFFKKMGFMTNGNFIIRSKRKPTKNLSTSDGQKKPKDFNIKNTQTQRKLSKKRQELPNTNQSLAKIDTRNDDSYAYVNQDNEMFTNNIIDEINYTLSIFFKKNIKHYKISQIKLSIGSKKETKYSLDNRLFFDSIIQLVDYYYVYKTQLPTKLIIPLNLNSNKDEYTYEISPETYQDYQSKSTSGFIPYNNENNSEPTIYEYVDNAESINETNYFNKNEFLYCSVTDQGSQHNDESVYLKPSNITNNKTEDKKSIKAIEIVKITPIKSNSKPLAYSKFYYGRLLREESNVILRSRGMKDGLFLLRDSINEIGSYVLSICFKNDIYNYKIFRLDDGSVKIEKGRKFIGPIELITHYQTESNDLITRPLLPCERPKETQPIYYLFLTDLAFHKLINDDINAYLTSLKSSLNAEEYFNEMNNSCYINRYKHEKNVLKNLHQSQSWFTANLDEEKATILMKISGIKDGKFVVRSIRENNQEKFFISLCYKGQMRHYKIHFNSKKYFLDSGIEFDTIIQLVDFYHRRAEILACRLLIPLTAINETPNEVENQALIDDFDECQYIEPFSKFQNTNSNQMLQQKSSIKKSIRNIEIKADETGITKFLKNENFNDIIESSDLLIQSALDEPGNFGEVFLGLYKMKKSKYNIEEIQVALKKLKIDSEESKNEITKEAELMKSLNNPHIIKFIGMCFQSNGSLMIVMELAKLGPLHKYLRTHKEDMSMIKIVKICYQVAIGMEYLSSKNLVHRDLAARNVLLVSEDLAKISDFGMSRLMSEGKYYQASLAGKWPLKWYPPDVMSTGLFDEKSDIWSFGVMFWEAVSYGESPYKLTDIRMLTRMLENGYRLEKPPTCPDSIYNIMFKCWNVIKEQRPTFSELSELILDALTQIAKQTPTKTFSKKFTSQSNIQSGEPQIKSTLKRSSSMRRLKNMFPSTDSLNNSFNSSSSSNSSKPKPPRKLSTSKFPEPLFEDNIEYMQSYNDLIKQFHFNIMELNSQFLSDM